MTLKCHVRCETGEKGFRTVLLSGNMRGRPLPIVILAEIKILPVYINLKKLVKIGKSKQ